ncbi:hypothetical protein BWP07_21880 [Bacteroides fragilis]|nr:hypothetical protein BWP07_21880 [Bacteroides fragilis]QCT80304.1 hypothetical protein E0L14_23305 [Bacteroides fragilis]
MQWFNISSDRKSISRTDTFSTSTGEKPGRNLIPYFSGFCPAWTIREHYYDTKNKKQYHSYDIKEWYFHLN